MDELDEQFEDEYRYSGGGQWSGFAEGVNFIQREVRVKILVLAFSPLSVYHKDGVPA